MTSQKPAFSLIDTPAALRDFVAHMSNVSADTLYIDTEFFKRNTYYPKLGLVQVALGEPAELHAFLLDAVKLDLTAFWQQAARAKLWVMHACSEDVDIIQLQLTRLFAGATNPPPAMPPLFDTQIGLSFLGFGLQLSYQEALEKCLSVSIEKEQSLSDWLARPLTCEQLAYAANDVLYLPALYQCITNRLTHKGLYDYAFADCQSLKADVCSLLADDAIYKNWADFRLSRKQLAQMQAVCAWRERTARSEDIPRTFVLKKSALRQLLDAQPKNTHELRKLKDMHPKAVRKYGEQILQLMSNLPNAQDLPHKVPRPFKEPKHLGLHKALKEKIAQAAERLDIPSDVLMRKRWLTSLYEWVAFHHAPELKKQVKPLPSYVTGWRMQAITQTLLDELSQHAAPLYKQIVPHEQKS